MTSQHLRMAGRFAAYVLILTLLVGSGLAWAQSDAPAEEESWTVQAISVRGNVHIDSDTVLDAVAITRVGTELELEQVQEDLQHIHDLGYFVDVRADAFEVEGGVEVVFEVVEHPVVQELRITSDVVPAGTVRGWMQTQEGRLLNIRHFEQDLADIQDRAVADHGVFVRPVVDFDDQAGIVNLELRTVRVDSVEIDGHEKTQEFVIAREVTFGPGDPLDRNEINRTVTRLRRLGYFEDVQVRGFDTDDPDRVIVQVDVVERKTGNASFGAGYSSQDGFIGYVEVSDRNFLGRGQQANLRWEFGRTRSTYDIGFTEPRIGGTDTSIGFNLYNRNFVRERMEQNQQVKYDERRAGGDVTVGRPISEETRGTVRFKLENTEINPHDPQLMDPDSGSTRSVTFATRTDTSDDWLYPSTGYRSRLSWETAGGMLGGDFQFNRYEADASSYFAAGDQGQIWAIRGMTGLLTGDEIPVHEEFRVGGSDTVRGYRFGAMRGDKKLVLSGEYRFPITDAVQGVVFSDLGQAWETDERMTLQDLRVGYGAGIRIDTPIGLLRIDYGIGDEGGRVHFSLGPAF